MELKGAINNNVGLRRRFIRLFFKCATSHSNDQSKSRLEECMVPKGNGKSGGGVVSWKEEEGKGVVVRMKIVVKKSQLKQLVEAMNGVKGVAAANSKVPTIMVSTPSSKAEQRLNHLLLRKNQSRGRAKPFKGNNNSNECCWSPALQSIPEEEY